ncbi:RNA-directed DNA polymerase [Microbacterium sp. EYE_5]|uniref:antiviral reverse transcriptase Drt3a n=1 Tax=unclassified Microbacterium TaxID=2609290 RepID=UPI0020048552|nr:MULTISPECIES: antiviral reverse transcriptase Drt3a [unclassified Microbacterium]MCK6081300.1 RNA-directed DNA polymerase [Microbacterium sp. EYE_382]MCK6086570.1 RNA-directed DNA polymerase [Microbacterium sp. EYE_384]MCK6123932.1 RNA-directed DNA polymerase [Microbacterium sp. EYE_80]MCK6126841.1 RNA-directed DNA polymerase [Microbacterium sp. EYE_79]MCK6142255.1 RNA-directed DNA polymerase [Microbacterium sp. EYE_39]
MDAAPYTLRSFVQLAERENRRGKDISRLDPAVGRATRAMRIARKQFFAAAANHDRADPARVTLRDEYRALRLQLRASRDQAVESALRGALVSFEEKLTRDEFRFGLTVGPVVGGKATYQIDRSLDVFYPAKQAAESIRATASVTVSSRNSIVRALQSALEKSYEHAVMKLDIEAFFESIPHSALLERLSRFSNLDSVSMGLTRQLLVEFEAVTGVKSGLPRGVGMSSHLAELYMTDFDSILKTHPGVLFYARYVDDVVIVTDSAQALSQVKDSVLRTLTGLQLKPNTTKTYNVVADGKGDYPTGTVVEYLGYTFARIDGKLRTGLTDRRKARRVRRLELALEAWLASAPNAVWPNHGHNGMLLDRIRYLAGNTRLLNSKSNVAIGLYFSNSALDDGGAELVELDQFLEAFMVQHASKMPARMRERMGEISFVNMFTSRPFLRFSQKRVEQIVSVWDGVS